MSSRLRSRTFYCIRKIISRDCRVSCALCPSVNSGTNTKAMSKLRPKGCKWRGWAGPETLTVLSPRRTEARERGNGLLRRRLRVELSPAMVILQNGPRRGRPRMVFVFRTNPYSFVSQSPLARITPASPSKISGSSTGPGTVQRAQLYAAASRPTGTVSDAECAHFIHYVFLRVFW
jgi:hypothetical protein